MDAIEQNLANWKASLVSSIPLGGLISRNAVVYKWKAPYRAWVLREAVFWRMHDLMRQSYDLYSQGHVLGARILLRSGYETVAVLIYLNGMMRQVIDGELSFQDFGEKTSRLLLGSKNTTDGPVAINIMTVLEKCDKRYPGILALYGQLSESAHPNYAGLCAGYSKINREDYETVFSNRWVELYGNNHLGSMELCMETFHHEYNNVWTALMEELEKWIEANDRQLEGPKSSDPLPEGQEPAE